MLKLNESVYRPAVTFHAAMKNEKQKLYPGRVVYIHPEGRYHAVAFKLHGGTVIECFKGCEN